MKKIRRNQAIEMYNALGNLSLGNLDEKMLLTVINDYNSLKAVSDGYKALSEELYKRLYDTLDKEQISKFFELVASFEKERTEENFNRMKDEYPDLTKIYEKQIKVLTSLITAEIDIDIEPIDKTKFETAILKGNPKISMHEINILFAPLYETIEDDKKEPDYSELDTLLND